MSTRSVIGALLLAIVLGAIAWLAATQGKGGGRSASGVVPVGDLILKLAPSRVRSVKVTQPDGRVEVISRAATDSPWMLRVSPPGGMPEDSPQWPVSPTRMSGLLRTLGNTPAMGSPKKGESVGDKPVRVAIEIEDGRRVTLQIADRRLGGNSLMRIEDSASKGGPRLAVVSDSLLNVFTSPGPRAWRATEALPGMDEDVSRLRLTNDAGSIALGRVQRAWRVTAPVGAAADDTAVENLIRTLGSVRIADFLDDSTVTPQDAGLVNPTATIHIEKDLPQVDASGAPTGRTKPSVTELRIGHAAESGQRVYALLDDMDHVVEIEGGPLASLTLDPTKYIRPAATGVSADNVGTVRLTSEVGGSGGDEGGASYAKTESHWSEVLEGGKEAMLDAQGERRVKALLDFLATAKPSTIAIKEPDGYSAVGRIRLGSIGDSPLDVQQIGVVPKAQDLSVAFKDGDVYRLYDEGAVPAIVQRFLGGTGAAAVPATPTSPDDLSK